MDNQMRQRGVMALTGALCGAGLYGLFVVLTNGTLPERMTLGLAVLAAVFAGALMALTGPLRLRRAVLMALALGAAVTLLVLAGSLRFVTATDMIDAVHPALAGFAVAFLPLPFVIAAATGPDWRDYGTLFSQSWALVVRALAASIFTAIMWGVIGLSHLLLGLVGVSIIETILDIEPMPWLITGAALGLSLAVATELSGTLSPALVVRLLRLLLIPVLAVLVLFLIALPLNGLDGFGDLSAAATLLVISAGGVTLVTTAVDRDDSQAVTGRVMHMAARALAVILPLPAALAGWAIWLRVAEYGWTPARLLAAVLALVGVGYGLAYALAVLRGTGWMARIRRANVTMSLVVLGLAALWLGVFPAESIAARDQLARIESGATPVSAIDLAVFDGWGKAGQAARARLEELASEPGREDLARLLAGEATVPAAPPALLEELTAVMPVQPAGSEATRDLLLPAVDVAWMQSWIEACKTTFNGRPGCVFVVADFLPRRPGEEALVVVRSSSGWVDLYGLGMGDDGAPRFLTVSSLEGQLPQLAEGEALLSRLQEAPPAMTPAPVNRIDLGGPETGLILLP